MIKDMKGFKKIIIISMLGCILIGLLLYIISQSPNVDLINRFVDFSLFAKLTIIGWPILTFITFFIFERFKITKYSICRLTCVILSFFIVMLFVVGILTHGEAMRSILFSDRNDTFMDFYHSVRAGTGSYQSNNIYPPLIVNFYNFLAKFIPLNDLSTAFNIRGSQMGRMLYLVYTSIVIIFLVKQIYSFKKGTKFEKAFFTLLTFFTLPFMFALERGNSILPTLLFVLIFIRFYTSTTKWLRIGSYIALGIATGIKIAPAILILLILRKKDYLKTLQAGIVICLIFIIPFLFTDGNVFILANNLNNATSYFQGALPIHDGSLRMMGHGAYVNFVNLVSLLGRYYNFNAYFIGRYINYIILIIGCIVVLFKTEMEEWKALTILMGLMVIFPGFSAIYCLIYMIIPFIEYIDYYEENHKPVDGYLILFVLLFIPFVNFKITDFGLFSNDVNGMRLTTAYESVAIVLLVIFLMVTEVYSIISNLRRRNEAGIICLFSVVAGYYLFYNFQPVTVDAFYPSCFLGEKAQNGFLMDKGLYKYIKDEAFIDLACKDVLQQGLTISLSNDNTVANDYEVYVENTPLKKGQIASGSKELIFIDGNALNTYAGEKKITVDIKNLGKGPLSLIYIGATRPFSSIKGFAGKEAATYIDVNSVGLFRDKNALIMEPYSRFLVSSDCMKKGMLFQYWIPYELINANKNREMHLDIYLNKVKIKTIPIIKYGVYYEVIDNISGISHENVDEIECRINGFYTNEQFDLDNDDRKRSIVFISFDNLKRDDFTIDNYFSIKPSNKIKLYYDTSYFKDKDLCIIYSKNQNLNQELFLQTKIDNNVVSNEPIEKSKENGLMAKIIPFSILNTSRQISELIIKMNSSDEDSELFINYLGPTILQENLDVDRDKDDLKKSLKRTSGLYYSDDIKALRMGKKAEILFDTNFIYDKDMEIDINVPRYLFKFNQNKQKKLDVYVDKRFIMSYDVKEGRQKIIIDKNCWKNDKKTTTLTLKSSATYNMAKDAFLPKELDDRSIELSYIGIGRN